MFIKVGGLQSVVEEVLAAGAAREFLWQLLHEILTAYCALSTAHTRAAVVLG